GALSFLSAITVGNIVGVAVAIGIFVEVICGCYLRGTADREIFNKISAILGVGSVAACIAAVIQHEIVYRNPDYRPTAGAFNANYYGALIVFTLIMVATRLLEKDSELNTAFKWYQPPKWVWAIVGIINLFALMYCRSRSSLLALMACAFIYLLLSRRWLTASVCGVCFGGVWLLGFFRPDIFDWQNSLRFIFEQRFDIWMTAWDSYLSSWRSILIGRGPMAYYFAKVSGAMHAHNILFDTLINVGILGLALYVLLLLDILRDSWNDYKSSGNGWLLSTVVVAEILVQGVFDVTIMWIQTGVMFFLLAFPIGKSMDTPCGEHGDGD
ncbi:MAG: O-antigen ligase family protein, partial [Clostridia bacterium]|nr:O-antigen ligase family protein [Clostridia bacterium]